MKKLEELSLGQRIALTMIIVLVILFALAMFGFLTGRWDQADAQPVDAPQLYAGIPVDAALLNLDKQALNDAYKAHLQILWSVWLRGQAGDPQNMINGLKIARRAYNIAATQIAKREQQLLELDRQQQDRK